jgi:hypothetical protein
VFSSEGADYGRKSASRKQVIDHILKMGFWPGAVRNIFANGLFLKI